MQFEHLVEINDLTNPLVAELTRDELWFGLLCRAEDPAAFIPGLEHCEIITRGPCELVRDLRFGAIVVRDRVSFEPLQWMCFETEANAQHAGGRLTISIEEPAPRALFLRFAYRTTLTEGEVASGVRLAAYVKSAYEDSDLDTVRLIRQMAEQARPQ